MKIVQVILSGGLFFLITSGVVQALLDQLLFAILNWQPQYKDLEKITPHTWAWEKTNQKG